MYVRTMKDMSVPEEQNPNPVLSCVMEVIALNVPAAATHRRSREGHRHMHFSTIFILILHFIIIIYEDLLHNIYMRVHEMYACAYVRIYAINLVFSNKLS